MPNLKSKELLTLIMQAENNAQTHLIGLLRSHPLQVEEEVLDWQIMDLQIHLWTIFVNKGEMMAYQVLFCH